jgi:hypothetical protein
MTAHWDFAGRVSAHARRNALNLSSFLYVSAPPACAPRAGRLWLFHFQIARAFVDFASPCFQHCLRLVFAARTIWKWN